MRLQSTNIGLINPAQAMTWYITIRILALHYCLTSVQILQILSDHPSVGVRRGGELVSWVLIQNDGAVGMLCTLEPHRGRGLARRSVAHLIRRCCEDGVECPPFAFIADDNLYSLRVFLGLGFERIASVVWADIDLDSPSALHIAK